MYLRGRCKGSIYVHHNNARNTVIKGKNRCFWFFLKARSLYLYGFFSLSPVSFIALLIAYLGCHALRNVRTMLSPRCASAIYFAIHLTELVERGEQIASNRSSVSVDAVARRLGLRGLRFAFGVNIRSLWAGGVKLMLILQRWCWYVA